MKTVTMETSQENSSKEEFISDEKIEKLLHSSIYEDMLLGRFYLLKKYPEILKNCTDHWQGDYSVYSIDNEVVNKHCKVKVPEKRKYGEYINTITGFIVNKDFLTD